MGAIFAVFDVSSKARLSAINHIVKTLSEIHV